MAQRVEVHLVDDIDGGDAAETIQFALDGTTYEIDLSADHAAKLRGTFFHWSEKARRVSGPAKATKRRNRGTTDRSAHLAAVREWAQANGYPAPARGRIPQEVHKAYEEAQAS